MKVKVVKRTIIIGIIIGTIFILPKYAKAMDCSGAPETEECAFGVNSCHWNCNNTPPPTFIPSCCDEIARTGDPTKCCFDARRVCTIEQCAAIQGPKQRCGQMWENTCCPAYGSGCPFKPPAGYTPAIIPTSTPQPTVPPSPTPTKAVASTPTIVKTPTPTPIKSEQTPTNPPAGGPTKPFTKTGENLNFQIERANQFPQINLPQIKINIVDLNKIVSKPLGLFEYLFRKIIYYDKKLEEGINNKISQIQFDITRIKFYDK